MSADHTPGPFGRAVPARPMAVRAVTGAPDGCPRSFAGKCELANLPAMRRNVAQQLAILSVCLAGGACVIPSATSPAGAPAAPATVAPPAASSHAPATVTEESRIAALSRVDLLGGASAHAFKVSGDVQKVDLAADTR